MFPNLTSSKSKSVYKLRLKDLVSAIKQEYAGQKGAIALFGGFEGERTRFRQESSFYYLTGIEEPGVVLIVELDGASTLYVPNYAESRSKWVQCAVEQPKTALNA